MKISGISGRINSLLMSLSLLAVLGVSFPVTAVADGNFGLDLNNGLVAYYPFNGNANDESGNGNNGTVNGATLSSDRFGNPNAAYSFDGVHGSISISNSSDLSFDATSPLTVALWAYRTSSSAGQHLLGKRSGCGGISGLNYQLVLDLINHNGVCFTGSNNVCSTGGGNDLPLNTWTHIVATSDGSILRLYINGISIGNANGTLGPKNSVPLTIGTSGTCGSFGGLIDDVRIYNRALSVSEVQDLYNTNQQQYTLTVAKSGTGGGTVTADSGTLSWVGNTGTASYNSNSSVALTATASSDSTFSSWSGCDSSNVNQCTVTMNAAKNVTATFTLNSALPHLDLGSASGAKGSTVTIPITLTNVSGTSISAIGMDIGYDTGVLENPTCTVGPAGSAAGKSCAASIPSSGIFRIGGVGLNSTAIGNGIVENITFTIKTTAPLGSTQLTNTPSASGPAGNAVSVSGSNGSVTIISKSGDCNEDNTVSIAEVQSAINMYLGLKAVAGCVDANGDGSVTIDEVQKVINCYLGSC